MMKLLAQLTIILFFLSTISAFFLLFTTQLLSLIAFLFSTFFLILLALFGDRIFLGLSRSQKIQSKAKIQEVIKNLSFKEGLPELEVYFSYQLPENVYCLKSWPGRPSLLITPMVLEKLDQDELEALIQEALRRIKSKEASQNLFYSLLFYFIELPLYFLSLLKLTAPIAFILGYFLIPIELLKNFILKRNDMNEIYSIDGDLGPKALSGFFKLGKGKELRPTTLLKLSKGIAIVELRENSLLESLTGSYGQIYSEILKTKFGSK